MLIDPGNVHDSQEFDKLLDCGRAKDKLKTCGEVYADRAYAFKVMTHGNQLCSGFVSL
jgi:hypothetical protein